MTKKSICMLLAVLLLCSLVFSVPDVYAEGLPFDDVKPGKWYYDSVSWAYENGYVSGITPTTFEPNSNCTRAQFVMILWVIADRPEPTIGNPFVDVKESHWFYKAVLWAKEIGLTDGKTPDTFAPNDTCSRAEAVFFIWKYFGGEVVAPEVQFTDVRTGAYYYNAVNWAFSNGITSGTDVSLFSPKTNVTRAMVVTFLYRQKHVLDGGQHEFALIEDAAASCTLPAYQVYACECGNSKTIYSGSALDHVFSLIEELPATCTQGDSKTYACDRCGMLKTEYSGEPLGHNFCKAKLIADATATSPTIYQLVCIRCGEHDGNGNRSLGKPIYAQPTSHNKYKSHTWTEDELINGIQFTSTDGATATIRRKWFANAWCYIAEFVLPEGAYSHFTGTNVVNMYGSNNPAYYKIAVDLLEKTNKVPDAQILVNGDTQLCIDPEHGVNNDLETMRAGVVYAGKNNRDRTSWSSTYWNPTNGTFGTVRDLVPDIRDSKFSTLQSLGITDVFCFSSAATVSDGMMDMTEFASASDYDESSYSTNQARRQRTMIGFKKEGTTVHIYFVVADGICITDISRQSQKEPKYWANDFASWGNNNREMMILLSTMDVDYARYMDGGHSAAMAIRFNGEVQQINAIGRDPITINGVTYSIDPAYRALWDFLYFR